LRTLFARLAMCLALPGLVAAPAAAAEGSIEVELNRLQQSEKACRMSLVFTNRLPVRLDNLELETVLFDADGRAGRFLVLKSQPLIPGKVRVSQYDLGETRCEDIGSILVNDVISCDGEGLTPAACLAALRLSSREAADLFLTVSGPAGQENAEGAEGGGG
jgi:hypothetical protein